MTRRHIIALAVVAAFALGAGSCDDKGLGDAPVGDMHEGQRTVIVMPDKFPNLAYFCDGTTAVIVTTRDAAAVVVPQSEFCDGEGGR